ncbi:MAG: hypothetical protein ACSHX9_00250 [Luteolibacter sp.]
MTFQIPDTLVLCGSSLNIESPGISLSSQPLGDDRLKRKPKGWRPPSPKKSSALRRGYVGSWEVGEDGRLFLTSLSGRNGMPVFPLYAEWVSKVISIPVGAVDETQTEKVYFEIVREACLELRLEKGTITNWRLVELSKKKRVRWVKGFDWAKITSAMEKGGIGEDFQPPRYQAAVMDSVEGYAKISEESAALPLHAQSGENGTGKALAEGAWTLLRKGWADPFPDLDVQAAVRAIRGYDSR